MQIQFKPVDIAIHLDLEKLVQYFIKQLLTTFSICFGRFLVM